MAFTEFDGELDGEGGFVEFDGELDEPKEGGFIASAKRAAGAGIKGAGQVAADFIPGVEQDNALKRTGQGIIDANPTAVNSLEDIAAKPGKAVSEATGNAASSMAGMIGARAVGQGITALSPLAGPAAPLVAAAGQVVSWLGPAAIAALPSFGGIRDKQILADPENQDSAKAKAIAAMGAATVGAIESRFGPQNWALAAMTKEGRAKLAEKFAATTLAGSIGKGAVKGAAIEGAEELVQNPIEQLASFDNPTTPESIKDTLFGGAMGAISGGVLGGATGAVFRGEKSKPDAVETITGKPVNELSDSALKYAANRGSEHAKKAAEAELKRRENEGADPSVRNAPESTMDGVERIISTGKEKAAEISGTQQEAPGAIQDSVFDEEPTQQAAPDAPTPEPVETLNAQMDALEEGRKPGMLLTPGEPMPETLPEGVQSAEIPGRGILLYRDEATLQAAQEGRMGEALGYGIDEKPGTDQVVTARDQNGTVIQDVATDGSPEVEQAAAAVAGPDGTVEVRPVEEALAERANSTKFEGIKAVKGTAPKANDGAVLTNNLPSAGTKPLTDKQIDHRKRLSKKAKERRFINSSDTLNQAIIKLGGIHESLRLDLTGDTKGNTRLPFVGALFSKKGTQDLSDLANQLQSYGYFTEQEINDVDGGAALLADRLRSEFNGAEAHRAFNSSDHSSDDVLQKHYEDMEFQAQQEAKDRGFAFDGVVQPEDIEVEGKQADAVNLVDVELLAKAIALDAKHVDMLAQEFEDSPDLFMQSIEEFIHEKENEGFGVDEDRIEGGKAVQSEEDIFGLESQSEEEIKTAEAEKEKAEKEAKKKADADEKTRKAAAEKKEVEERGKKAGKELVLGGSAMDELAGQKDIFSTPKPIKRESEGTTHKPNASAVLSEKIGDLATKGLHPVRPLVESLIKRRAAARQGGKNLSTAIDRAKEVMDGKRTDAKVEGRYFRLQAKAFERADPEAAKILGQIAESIKDNAPKLSRATPQTATEAFKKWFDGSKVVDKDGSPLRVYHGTSDSFSEFEHDHPSKKDQGWLGRGFYFTNQHRFANDYTYLKSGSGSPNVMPVFLTMKNPYYATQKDKEAGMFSDRRGDKDAPKKTTEKLIAAGYDGVILDYGMTDGSREYVVFNPEQIKSAIGNNGNFDGNNPDIRFSNKLNKQSGLSVPEVEKSIASLQQAGFKKINVAATQNDLPQKVKEQIKSQNAGNVRGVYLPDSDEIFIVADQLNDATEAVMVALHEARHRGLRKMFGSGVDPIMRQIYATNKRVRDAADRMMKSDKDMSKEEAVEEVLADMPIDQAKALNGWKRLVRFIKQWISEKLDLAFTDEMVEQLVAGAEVVGLNESQTETPAFKKWFKDSKVVDENGMPLVVYHGTVHDIEKFDKSRLGETTKADSAANGFFFTSDTEIANGYSDVFAGRTYREIERRRVEAEKKAMRTNAPTDWDAYNDLSVQLSKQDKVDRQARTAEGANVLPVFLSIQNPVVVDFAGRDYDENGYMHAIDQAKKNGNDGVIFRNAVDDPVNYERAADIYVAFSPEQIKSATGNNGNFDPNNPDIRFSRKPGSNASWDAPEPSKIDNLIYSLQNKHVDLKRVMESIRDTGTQLAEKFDAYLQEELFHGRAAKRTKDFVNNELKPLIAALKLRGISIDELDKYLHARHAQEANALIAQRDPKMLDGGSGMTNQEAQDYLSNLAPEKKRKLDQTAKKVDDIISKTRDLYVSYGLIDQAQADSWEQMFQHYVPLMREDKDGGMGIGQGFSIKGKEAKHRTGSKRKVVDILANIALQREKAIVRGEKNRVAVSLAGLAKLNPNPEFWTFDKAPTDRVLVPKKNTYEVHYHGSKVMEFTSPVEANKFITFQGDPAYTMNKVEIPEHIEERADPMFKNRDNVVVAKIKDSKGKVIERAVIFNEDNERAMRMATAIKNLDSTQLEGLMGVSAKVTRYFAAINTQYNPVFGVVNLVRDLQASLLNLSSTPIAGHKAEVLKHVIPAIHAIYSSSRGERTGKKINSPMAQRWDELQKEGGMTGYRDLFKTSEDRANAIKRELDPTAWMNSKLGKVFTAGGALKVPLAVAQKQAGWIFDLLSDYNQTLEGAMRLSVYKVAIDKGLSKPRAASIAKNISVNFNRKGQSGQQAGALYAFFNAAMQGTARIGETMTSMDKGDIKTLKFNRTGKQIIVGGITLGAVQALALTAAGFDDDEPPEFIRERNLIIPIGDKKYVTIPMPLGFHAIPNIGRISTEFAMSGFKKPVERTAQLFMIFAEAFNPIGTSSTLSQTVSPTVSDPLVALGENKDWTGKPIAKEDFNKLSPTPGFSRNKDTASDPAKWIAEAINTISGGNKYVPGMFSPTADQIDYLAGQVTGGVGREAGKIQQSASAAMTGEELPPHKIPLVGRFYGNSDNSSSQGNAFYANLKRINEVEAELTGRRKDRLPIDEFKAENPEHRLVVRGDFVQRLVSKQRKIKSELLEKGAPKEEVKAVEERITKLMTGFNNKVKKLKEEARQ